MRDVLAHLAGAELGHQQVIRALLAGAAPDTSGFDLDAFNAADVAARRNASLSELLDELAANRSSTLALLDAVGPDDWDRAGYHPGGFDTTVEGAFRIIAIHEKRHVKEIRAALASEEFSYIGRLLASRQGGARRARLANGGRDF